jgi:hypothetical protein
VPAFRNRPPLSTSKKATSAPLSDRSFVPRPSSVTRRSATLIRVVVFVFSSIDASGLSRVIAVGARFSAVDGA